MQPQDRESVEWLLDNIEKQAEREAERNAQLSARYLRDGAALAGMAETLRGPDLGLYMAVAGNPTLPPSSGGE
jgi:hypothetical protein